MLWHRELGSGPALVLLHAFPLDHSLYDEVTAPLAELGWRVITPDLPGFGASPEAVASIDDMASQVALLLDTLGEQRVVIGGCSMGGYVAMAFAAQFPQRTAGLILIDTKGNADGEEARANRERIATQVETSGSTAALAATQAEAMLSASTRTEAPQVEEWLRATILRQRPRGVAAAQRAMAQRAEQFAMLASLHVPVLSIRGSDDVIASADDHARLAAAARDGLDCAVPDAGHLLPIEQPAAFVQQVSDFLARIRAPHC